MLQNANPDDQNERSIALSDIVSAVKEGLRSFDGWGRFTPARPSKDLIVCSYPGGVTKLETGIINKVVQSIASLGWKVQTIYQNEVSMHCAGVKTRVAIEFKPEANVAFTIRFI